MLDIVAPSLVDSVFSDAPSKRSRRVIAQLVQATLADLAQIEQLDDSLAPDEPTQFDRRTAALLRDEYERWAINTASLLERIGPFETLDGPIPATDSLRHAFGKTRARLSISLDDMEESLRALSEGRLIPMEGVHRGLL